MRSTAFVFRGKDGLAYTRRAGSAPEALYLLNTSDLLKKRGLTLTMDDFEESWSEDLPPMDVDDRDALFNQYPERSLR